jgi:hypothetical protein
MAASFDVTEAYELILQGVGKIHKVFLAYLARGVPGLVAAA